MHHPCIASCHSDSMENDLLQIRRWLLQDFKARASTLVPVLLAQNPTMEAFDLMAAVEATETMRPLRPEYKAFVLDQYLQVRWTANTESPKARRPPRSLRGAKHPLYRR